MRRLCALAFACLTLLTPAAEAADPGDARLRRELAPLARSLGSSSGIYVLDATDRDVLFSRGDRRSRILASNAKLFTTAAALGTLGAEGTLPTTVVGVGEKDAEGVFDGDLYLVGGGDPTFGRENVDELARQLEEVAQISGVRGRVYGDESRWDSLRGGPDSNFGPSPWHAQLSALTFGANAGLNGRTPAERAAAELKDALEDRRVDVRGSTAARQAPAGATTLAAVESPEMARLVRITNKESSNFFAEMLLKVVSSADGDQGTTRDGAADAAAFARRLGARARIADGSGLSRGNRASPRSVVELLDEMRDRVQFEAFYGSLSIAGVDGTLAKSNHRGLRSGPARRRCRGKTGTLNGVSALSGYCTVGGGEIVAFSILSNNLRSTDAAKRIEDRILHALVRYG